MRGYAYRIYERGITEDLQQQYDADYWAWVATQPLPYQREVADWFRRALQAEYAQRVQQRIPPDAAPVPSYDDVVAHLHANPTAW